MADRPNGHPPYAGFTRPETAQVLFDGWIWQQGNVGLTLYGFVVLENHLHAMAQAPDLPAAWAQFKSFTARRLIQILEAHGARRLLDRMLIPSRAQRPDRSHQFWQEGSHPQGIGSEDMLRQKIEYIHRNPVERGFVDEPEHWR